MSRAQATRRLQTGRIAAGAPLLAWGGGSLASVANAGVVDGANEVIRTARDYQGRATDVLPGVAGKIFATVCQAKPLDIQRIAPLQIVLGLTKAETFVLSHLACGDAPKDIGRKMDMSIHTVRPHFRAIFMRMGVKGINIALRLSLQLTALTN